MDGKLLLFIIEIIRGKKISENLELKLTAIGVLILLSIAVFVTINDVGKLL